MNSEDRIIKFVERELTPDEERAVLDECSTSDEMRGLLKQHVALSRNVAAALSAVSIPARAEAGLSQRIAAIRNPSTGVPSRAWRIGGIAAAVVGAVTLAVTAVMLFTPHNSLTPQGVSTVTTPVIEQQRTPQPLEPVAPPAPRPAPTATSVHRRPSRHIDQPTTQLAEKSPEVLAPRKSPKQKPRKIPLSTPDEVHP